MKPVPHLPTIDPKALAEIHAAGSGTMRVTDINAIKYDQTYLHWNKGRWEVYKRDDYPRLVWMTNSIFQAIMKARLAMPWYRR